VRGLVASKRRAGDPDGPGPPGGNGGPGAGYGATAPLTVTSHDVARLAGVAQSTVSRALRGAPSVSSGTRARVHAAAAQLGYTPSELGRSLVTRSTRTIGIVVTDLTSVFYPYVMAPLHEEVTAHGYRMVVFTEGLESNGPSDDDAIRRLLDRSIDGAVLTTSRLEGTVPRELARRGLPFVFLTRYAEDIAGDCAVVDNSLGASLMAAEVVRIGHRRVAAIFGPSNTSTGRDRDRGTCAALAAAGVELPEKRVQRGPFLYETGYRSMGHLMALDPRATVVICANDTVAIGALNAARSLGLRVPEDVSVVGFDDLPMAAWEVFQLTTVHQPMEDMARTAVRLLVDRIEGRVAADDVRRVVFEPQLVIRQTLAPPTPSGLSGD
jgi:LacI family transcriptional regulator